MSQLLEMNGPKLGRFGPDPETSFTLPGDYYYDPEILVREKAAIFYRTWQYAGHLCQLAVPGDFLVRDLFEQSVVILRDRGGELRGYHNVCQHRAHRLLEGEGRLSAGITCPYHLWTYDLGGKLRGVRGSERVKEFDQSGICLQPVQVEIFCGFVFYNLDLGAPALREQTAGLEEEIRSFSPEPENLQLAHQRDYPMQANWKNSVENYSECYHCPNQHKSLSEGSIDLNSYTIKIHEGYHSHQCQGRSDGLAYEAAPAATERPDDFASWLIWPNTVLEIAPGAGLNIFHHHPVGPEETVQRTEWYYSEPVPSAEEQSVIDFMHNVRVEDVPICETVQRGLHSFGYSQGRFIVDSARSDISEHAVHDFQLKVVRALGDVDF